MLHLPFRAGERERESRAVIQGCTAATDGIGGTAYEVEDDGSALVGKGGLRDSKVVDTRSKNLF